MKKYKWASIGIFILALLFIIFFQSYSNLIEITRPPSEMWGRDKLIGVTSFRREPIASYDGNQINVTYAEEKNFKRLIIDNNGNISRTESFNVVGFEPEKLKNYQGSDRFMLMLEAGTLYYVNLEEVKNSYDRTELLSGVVDFRMLQSSGNDYLAVYTADSIDTYQLRNGSLTKLTDSYKVNGVARIDLKQDSKGLFHLAYIAIDNSGRYNLMYSTYDKSSEKWINKVNPYIIQNPDDGALSDLQLCFDDEDAYLFYGLNKATAKVLVAKMYYGRIPKNSEQVLSIDFTPLYLDESSYIYALKSIDESSNVLHLLMTTPYKALHKDESNELIYVAMDKGRITEKVMASSTGQWTTDIKPSKLGEQQFVFFLQTVGMTKYEIKMTSSGEQYKQNANKPDTKDFINAVAGTAPGYVFAVLPILLGFLITSPVLLWILAVDLFRWQKFYKNEALTFNVGAALEAMLMLYNINTIYRNSNARSFLPHALNFTDAKYIYLVLTFAVAYLITWLYKKGTKELHIFPQMVLFILTHLIIVNFLYAKYIAGF